MKNFFGITVSTFLLATLLVTASVAQTPYVAIYFDEELEQVSSDCAREPIFHDTLYVVARNFNMLMASIEYRVDLDPLFLGFIGDIVNYGVPEGWATTGIRISYPTPVDATGQLVVQGIWVLWECVGSCPGIDIPVNVVPHPISGKIQAVRWPDLVAVEGVGVPAYICPSPVPVEDTTWGTIKALYEESAF